MTIEQLAEAAGMNHAIRRRDAVNELHIGRFRIREVENRIMQGIYHELYYSRSGSMTYLGDIDDRKLQETIEAINALRGCLE